MRNGTRSNKLTLVNGTGQVVHGETKDLLAEQDDLPEMTDKHVQDESEEKSSSVSLVLILFTVSLACTTAAIAAGSYALWLSRQKSARQTLTDVQDILQRCQERMHQMEDDLNRLPNSTMSRVS